MTTYRAFRIQLAGTGVTRALEDRAMSDLPGNDVLIRVHWSSLNYKDALSASGHKGISRYYPHTPGIDAAGIVERDLSGQFEPGAEVAVIGFDLGMNTQGGFAEYVCVPAGWVVPLPAGLSMADSMRLGTAGVTAAYCLEKLIENGVRAADGPIVITGATGGVGSIAVHLLASLGYKVTAVTGKPDAHNWLRQLGATDILARAALSEPDSKALRKAEYAGAIDTVGDHMLANILKSLKYGGSVAACGIVGGTAIPADIFPFILRGVNLLGVASADAPLDARKRVLAKYVQLWKLPLLDALCDTLTLDELEPRIESMLAGNIQRRALIRIVPG